MVEPGDVVAVEEPTYLAALQCFQLAGARVVPVASDEHGTTWTDPDGGMFVWLRLPGAVDTVDVLQRALANNVAFVPGAPFFATNPDPATFRLSFTTNTPDEITEGMARLATALA